MLTAVRLLSGLLLFTFWLATLPAQSLSPALEARIDRLISTEMARRQIPGLSVAIAIADGPVWAKGYGFADLENFVPVTERSRFRLASVSKPITAVAVLQLVEQGRASLDDDVRAYLPDFPQKQWTVRIGDLLSHLSGIRGYREGETQSTTHYPNIRDGLVMFAADPLEHEPGSKYLYSSYGFNLVGAAAEVIAGKPFRQLLAERVFGPAGMVHARDDHPFALIPGRVSGYRKTKTGEIQNCVLADTSNKVPGGGMIATATDVVLFGRAVLNGVLLKPETRERMWTPRKTKDGKPVSYGLGWNVTRFEGKARVYHSGGQPGAATFFDVLPEQKIVVAVLTNLEGAEPKTISEEILRLLLKGEKAEE